MLWKQHPAGCWSIRTGTDKGLLLIEYGIGQYHIVTVDGYPIFRLSAVFIGQIKSTVCHNVGEGTQLDDHIVDTSEVLIEGNRAGSFPERC